MKKCEECGKYEVEFSYNLDDKEIWECRRCGARYTLGADYGELERLYETFE
jgi:ribosomal protein L37AE/L43A